jgi:hypothetical protein
MTNHMGKIADYNVIAAKLFTLITLWEYVCMYVRTRVGQRLALAPRPLMIYCASPFD